MGTDDKPLADPVDAVEKSESAAEVQDLQAAWDFMMNQARLIAMCPIEEWLESLDRAESVAPILDPTLYRDYIYSGKGELLKSIFRPALALKRAVLAAQRERIVLGEHRQVFRNPSMRPPR